MLASARCGMTLDEITERFEELPERVQVAVVSNLHGMRSRRRLTFSEYPLPVAQYIQATGFMDVTISEQGAVNFIATDTTSTMKANIGALLKLMKRLDTD
jgi:hypothetical protein